MEQVTEAYRRAFVEKGRHMGASLIIEAICEQATEAELEAMLDAFQNSDSLALGNQLASVMAAYQHRLTMADDSALMAAKSAH